MARSCMKQRQRPHHRVRFLDGHQVPEANSTTVVKSLVKPCGKLTVAEKAAMWYQAADYACMKQNIHNISMSIKIQDACDHHPFSYGNVASRIYQSSKVLPHASGIPSEHDVCALEYWTKRDDTRRGLEKWSVPFLKKERILIASASTKAVMLLQLQMRNSTIPNEAKAEYLRAEYLKYTIAAKNFARLLAKADAAAALEYYALHRIDTNRPNAVHFLEMAPCTVTYASFTYNFHAAVG